MSSEEPNTVYKRRLANGAQLVVCSEQCLFLLEDSDGSDGYVATVVSGSVYCAHCYGCGTLLAEPERWCDDHGINCPDIVWRLTAQAKEFAATYAVLTHRWVSDAVWDVAEHEYWLEPWLTGNELAERVCAL